MAKVSARYSDPNARKRFRSFKLKSQVSVTRTGGDGKKAFQACISVGGLLPGWKSDMAAGWPAERKRASSFSRACMFGSNPRAALASAFARATRQFKKRQGAFAGLAESPKRRRTKRR